MKVLLVTLHFPPGGGGGVHRPLKFATHLPALGIETHVLAPDIPGAVPADLELELPTQAWIHRVRYVGPRAGRSTELLAGTTGLARVGTQAGLLDALLAAQPEVSCDAVFEKVREELRSFSSVESSEPPKGFQGELRPYQKEGLGWLYFLQKFGFGAFPNLPPRR